MAKAALANADHARNPALDGLRGIAVLLVVFHHVVLYSTTRLQAATRLEHLISGVGLECWAGVDLFFVLSGFLITGILLRARDWPGPGYFKNFYARRILRIFPLYYLYVACLIWVLPMLLPGDAGLASAGARQAWLWTYTSNIETFRHVQFISFWTDHLWSLSIEEQFYLVWPLLVAWLGARRVAWLALAVFATQAPVRWLMGHSGLGGMQLRMFTLSHLDGLMLGAGLAALLHLGVEARNLRRAAAGLIAAGLALRTGICLTGLGYEVRREVFYIASWSVVFAGVLGLAVLGGPSSALSRVLRNRALVFFGTYSYGIYLVHQPMMHFFFDRFDFAGMSMLGCWIRTVLWGVPPTLLLALALYHGFEKRFLDLKRHFVTAGGQGAPAPAYATSVALSTSGRGVVSG